MQTILISLPVFLIIFLGWLFHKLKLTDKNWVHVLNEFAYYIALPCLIISSFWQVDFLNQSTWFLILESVTIIILFSILIFAIAMLTPIIALPPRLLLFFVPSSFIKSSSSSF